MNNTYAPPSLTVYGSVSQLTRASDDGGGGDTFFFNVAGDATSQGSIGEATGKKDGSLNVGDCGYMNGSTGTMVQVSGASSCSTDNLDGWDGENVTGLESFIE